MKHFLPSSVMLIPFVVKPYPESDDEIRDNEQQHEQTAQLDLQNKRQCQAGSDQEQHWIIIALALDS
ncbi:hypothetical protein [Vibrio fluvialis]|uniref:hypothetical protein n=2 Tax=Vibrio fluvialis TaxID=676 RepID=UPI003D108AAA